MIDQAQLEAAQIMTDLIKGADLNPRAVTEAPH